MKDAAFPQTSYNEGGMTLRDHFAGQALPTILKALWDSIEKDVISLDSDEQMFKLASDKAYAVADAMIKARQE